MNKTLYMAFFAALLFVGCAKSIDVSADHEIKVEFEIAEKTVFGVDTKAVKEGWAQNDVIRVAFSKNEDGTEFPLLTNNANTLSFRRKSTGTWQIAANHLDLDVLNDVGVYKAIHYPGWVEFGSSDLFGTELLNYSGGEYMTATGEYEIVGDVLKIKGPIVMERPEELIQVSVKNLAANDGKWTLTIFSFTDTDLTGLTHLVSTSLSLDAQANSQLNPNNNINAMGVKYGNDISYCFFLRDNSNMSQMVALKFILTDGTDTYTYSKIIQGGLVAGKAYLLPALDDVKGDGNLYWTKQ